MNLPASISSFMTSSCPRYWSISLQAINIKMKFLSVLLKVSWHHLFSYFFLASFGYLFINLLFQPILFQFLSSHKKHFFSPFYFWLFFLSRGAWILFYTPLWLHLHRSGNKKWVWRMCRDPAGLQTAETCVMISQLLIAVADAEAVCRFPHTSLHLLLL